MRTCKHCGQQYELTLFGVNLPDFEGCYDCWCKELEKTTEYTKEEIQENSFACRLCGTYWSEESGASDGFICEDCLNDYNYEGEIEN
jgi:hypothetical protein